MLDKIWNGKISGIPEASLLLIKIFWVKAHNKLSIFLISKNLIVGKGSLIFRGVKYRYPKSIRIGRNVIVGHKTSFTSESADCEKYLRIEDGVSIGNHCIIDFTGGVILRKDSHLAHEVQIITHHHGYDYKIRAIGKPLEIGEYAFLGNRCTILPNCNRIGKHTIIGACSVVTKDVPDYAIVAGNPAKIIKYISQ